MKFTELNLPGPMLKALERKGFSEMTPIQEAVYPVISAGNDLCALAETGSGKTAACAIPLIQKVDPARNCIQALVLVPTRELCLQYMQEINDLAAGSAIVPFAIYGGFSKEIQRVKIRHEVHILVATPGRLIDLMYDGVVDLSDIRCLVLDEADELLKVGFIDDIHFILSCIRHEHQTLLFSATMGDDIKALAHECLREPVHISLIKKQTQPASIQHCFAYMHPREKHTWLVGWLKKEKVSQAIIFCNSRLQVDRLYRDLKKEMQDVDFIHAGLDQRVRTSIFRNFRNRRIRYLLASDVAGRGLDFSHVSHVINWDFPGSGERYTHRTGRCGRMGRKGTALTFIARHDLKELQTLFQKKHITPDWIGKDPFSMK